MKSEKGYMTWNKTNLTKQGTKLAGCPIGHTGRKDLLVITAVFAFLILRELIYITRHPKRFNLTAAILFLLLIGLGQLMRTCALTEWPTLLLTISAFMVYDLFAPAKK